MRQSEAERQREQADKAAMRKFLRKLRRKVRGETAGTIEQCHAAADEAAARMRRAEKAARRWFEKVPDLKGKDKKRALESWRPAPMNLAGFWVYKHSKPSM